MARSKLQLSAMSEIEKLKKEVELLRKENQSLKLRLDNVTLLLKKEMIAAGKLQEPSIENGDSTSG